MAIVAPQEEASSDDVLIWRYAASRARQAAEAARAKAREAAAEESAQRRGLRTLGPALERAVRSVRIARPPVRREAEDVSAEPAPEVWAAAASAASAQAIWTPPEVWVPRATPVLEELPAIEPLVAPAPLPVVSLDDIVAENAAVPLAAAMLLYDDVLEWLQRLHASGVTHGAVETSAVTIDREGRGALRGGSLLGGMSAVHPATDLQAATAVFVDTIRGTVLAHSLPLPARCLVEQTMAVEAASDRLTAARLRSDLAVAARAFLSEDWELSARTWLATAMATAAGIELIGLPSPLPAPGHELAGLSDPAEPKRAWSSHGASRREPKMMIGLGIAASASITLVVGAAVGLTGPRAVSPPHAAVHHAAITAPAPLAIPTAAAASPAALLPTPTAAPPSAVPAPPPPPVQVHAAPPSVAPVVFTPAPIPPTPATTLPSLAPSPTPGCLLGIICG